MAYTPTLSDLEWTRKAIDGRIVWAVPSIGCVILLHHETQSWVTYMKSNPTNLETINYEKIESNLNALGYQESSAKIIGQANNVNDVLVVLQSMIHTTEEERELDDFWARVKNSIANHFENQSM